MGKINYKVTGDTFKLKNKIKKAGGKWNSAKKCWTVELYKSDSLWRYEGRINFTPVNTAKDDGYCKKCNTYCFGDCEA